LDHRGIVRRAIAVQDFRRARARLTRHVDDIFDRDRNPAQRKIDVRMLGRFDRAFEIE
jgi:hypothetical protein